jgi:hypothetical protein
MSESNGIGRRPGARAAWAARRRWVDALTAALLAYSALQMTATWRLGLVHGNDFKHLWAGARILALGGNPYDGAALIRFAVSQRWVDEAGNPSINPFVYLPTTGLLLWPLAQMPFGAAQGLWFWLNAVAAWAMALAGPSMLGVRRRALARLASVAFLAAALPFFRQMTAGQMNVLAAWAVLGAAAALRRRRDGLAGSILALGFGWKIAPALLIAALLPLRRPRALVVAVAGSAALWLASFLIAGPAVQADGLRTIRQMGYGHSTWEDRGRDYYRDPANQSPNSLMHHLLAVTPYARPWAALGAGVANAMTLAFSLSLVAAWGGSWLAARRRRVKATAIADAKATTTTDAESSEDATTRLFLAASLAMLLLPSLMWDHYVVQALPALAWVAGDARVGRSWPRALGLLAIVAALAWPVAYSAPALAHGAGLLVMSIRLWPTLGLYFWLLLDRAEPKACMTTGIKGSAST